MPQKLVFYFMALMLSGCSTEPPPPEEQLTEVERRRPALGRMRLIEGLNIVDRVSSGHRLIAQVQDGQITDWSVVDEGGQASVFQQSDGDSSGSWDFQCALGGGLPDRAPDGVGVSCCWGNWGCLVCDSENGPCEMICKTQGCRDANGESLPPGGVVGVPGGTVVSVDPNKPGWTLTDSAGTRVHVPARATEGTCPICVPREIGAVCWELPCLPTSAASRDPSK